MASADERAGRGRDWVVLTVVIGAAAAFALLVVGVNVISKRTIEQEFSELDREDLVTVEDRRRLPAGFTAAADVSGPLAIEAEVYVPVYSSIYAGRGALRSDLAATLSIRNTSLTESIVVRDVRYFDTDGNVISRFVDGPHRLGPMATADFFIDASDTRGGTGANFVVKWASDTAVSEPLIEAVMIGSIGAKGISFISRGMRVDPAPTPLPAGN